MGRSRGGIFFPIFFPISFFVDHFFISRPMLDFLCPAGRAGGSLYRAPTAAPLLAGCSGCFGPFRAKTAILGQNGTFDVENDRRDLASARKRFSFQPTLFVLLPLPPTHRENRSKRRLYSAPRLQTLLPGRKKLKISMISFGHFQTRFRKSKHLTVPKQA